MSGLVCAQLAICQKAAVGVSTLSVRHADVCVSPGSLSAGPRWWNHEEVQVKIWVSLIWKVTSVCVFALAWEASDWQLFWIISQLLNLPLGIFCCWDFSASNTGICGLICTCFVLLVQKSASKHNLLIAFNTTTNTTFLLIFAFLLGVRWEDE